MMNEINLIEKFEELLDNIDEDNMRFSAHGIEIINEIADFAETSPLFDSNRRNAIEFEASIAYSTAWDAFLFMLERIACAPFSLYVAGSIILMMPIIRRKL